MINLHNRQLRDIYIDLLIEAAKDNANIVLVEADLMKAAKTTEFAHAFPERVINVGVAEANMIGVAAGLNNMGKIPFTHTFTPFATRRAFDQVMLSVAYSRLSVKMIGMDPGIMAQLNGGTHMSFEDVGIMRNIPTMTIFEPVDGVQLASVFNQIIQCNGPIYVRLLCQEFDSIFTDNTHFTLGKAHKIFDGTDVSIFATGIMVNEAIKARELLKEDGISASVVNIHTVKPIDVDAVVSEAKNTRAIVTAENHNIINGLGSAVAEVLAENYPAVLERVGIKDHFGEVGKKDFLMEKFNLLAIDITLAAKRAIERKSKDE